MHVIKKPNEAQTELIFTGELQKTELDFIHVFQ